MKDKGISLIENKVVLLLPPFWTPLIPPQGISRIKTHLCKNGFDVKIYDPNIVDVFKETYQEYFSFLKEYIPEEKWGNIYNIGHNVLRNLLMLCFNKHKSEKYYELFEEVIYLTFFHRLSKKELEILDKIFENYYRDLDKYIEEILINEKPKYFGVSAHLGNLSSCMFATQKAKKMFPEICNVLGGSLFGGDIPIDSSDYKYFLKVTPYIDKIILGKGEIALLKLVKGDLPDDKRIITSNDLNGESLDFNSVFIPDYKGLDIQKYPYNTGFVTTSCPFQCTFCNVVKMFGEYKTKSFDHFTEEIMTYREKYGGQLFFLLDSLLNNVITELSQKLIKEKISMYFDGYMRVSTETTDPDNAHLWRKGGLYRARLGIESGSQRILDLIDKQITVEMAKDTLKQLASAGIKTTAYFVVGFPEETEEDFQKTLDFLTEMKDYIWEAESNPFYYLEIENQGKGWRHKQKKLFPSYAQELLITQTWIIDENPTRKERYNRLQRFANHIKKIGIPNPYSVEEIYQADKRWTILHSNAVPMYADFTNPDEEITENLFVKKEIKAELFDAAINEIDF